MSKIGFPLQQEKRLRLLYDWGTYEFKIALKEIQGKEEITKKDEKKLQKALDKRSDEMAEKLIDIAGSFQGQVYKTWMAELKLKEPLIYTEITNSKSWVQQNIKYHRETAEKSFYKLNKIREERKYRYFKEIGESFEFRVNKEKLSKGDMKYIKNFLKAQGYDKKLPNLDKYTGDDIKKLTKWVRRRNQLVARDQAGDIYSSEIKELALANDIKQFVWFTEGDNRVREEHVVKDRKTYNFKTASELPGEKILCRCHAMPVKTRKNK